MSTGNTFCIALIEYDKILVIGASSTVIACIEDTIKKAWSKGVQSEKTGESFQFKLKGNPWIGNLDEFVPARRLLVALFQTLLANGWRFFFSTYLSQTSNRLSLLFMSTPPINIPHFAISFNESDKIRFIDAPSDLYSKLKEAVSKYWKQGIQDEKDFYGSKELKLKGKPWFPVEAVQARILILGLMETLQSFGWEVVASIDISTREIDYDTWIVANVRPT